MKHKWNLLVALLVIMALALVACGGETTDEDQEPVATEATTDEGEEAEPTEEMAEEPTEEMMEEATEEPMEEATEEPMEEATEEPMEEATEPAAADATTITLWHGWDGTYYEAIEDVFTAYEEMHPEVNIELVRQDNLSDAMAVAVPAGEGPDILAWVQDQIGRNALTGNIVPITEWVDEAYLTENFEPAAATAMIWQGDVWGVPESQEGIALVFNRELISEEDIPSDPFDFDGLLAAATAFREANPDKYFLCNQGVGVTSQDAFHVAPIYFGFGGDDEVGYVDDEGNIFIDTPERQAAAEWLLQFKEVAPEETSHEICQAGLQDGTYAAWWTGPWAIAGLEEAGVDYGIVPFGRPFVGVKLLMMGANAVDRGHEEIVVDIMQYFGSEEVQTQLALVNGTVPANSAALNSPEVQEVYSSSAFGASLSNGIAMPNTPFIDAQWGPVGAATAAIFSAAQDPATALAEAQAAAEETIEGMR
jgi:arabinogalactan oligomer / maltooligosaccharide transport system substrate-binding protein